MEFCKYLRYYATCEMVESDDASKGFPIGVLVPKDNEHLPIHIYFEHYKSFEEAKSKWQERFRRVDYDNIYFIWEFYDTAYPIELASEFDDLCLKHKMIITHREFPELKNSFTVSCYIDDEPVAKILQYDGLSGKRYLDKFDYVEFINRK